MKTVAIDTECVMGGPWPGAVPFMVQACDEDGATQCWEWDVDPHTREPAATRRDLINIRRLCENPTVAKVFHNAPFDLMALRQLGIAVRGPIHDTLIAAHVCDSRESTKRGLKELADQHLGYPVEDRDLLHECTVAARRWAKKNNWPVGDSVFADYWLPRAAWLRGDGQVPELWGTVCRDYGVGDVERTILLWKMYRRVMEKLDVRHIYELERRVAVVVDGMRMRGIRVSPKNITGIRRTSAAAAQAVRGKLSFNPDSPKQLQAWMFGPKPAGLGLSPVKFTKTGASTDKDVLAYYGPLVPRVAELQTYRQHTRILSYLDAYRRFAIHNDDGWILHAEPHQLGARTGRFSYRNPNLQNIPNREKESALYQVRRAFIPRKGRVLVCFDFKQIEARIFAAEAREETMLAAFRAGRDVYLELAQTIYGARRLEKEPDLRDVTKHNFLGRLYGMQGIKLAARLGKPLDEAMGILDDFDRRFPRVPAFMSEVTERARRDGYVRTRYGRRIPVSAKGPYTGVAYICQGGAADLIKLAMVRLADRLRPGVQLLVQIHDELVFESLKPACTPGMLAELKARMETQDLWDVPTPVDCAIVAKSWDQPEPLEL